MAKILEHRSFKDFIEVNEFVAKTSPMRLHYHSHNPLERWLWNGKKETIKNILKDLTIENILDLGCGDGGLVDLVDEKVAYVGVDISPTQVSHAKQHIDDIKRKNAKILLGDITDLTFKDNTFDAALVCDVVEHVLAIDKLFKEIKRVVKKNGYIIFSIPNEFLLEATRAILLRFPLRSPDHINAIYPSDIRQNFPTVLKNAFLPLQFSSKLSLIHIFLVKNAK